VAPNDPGEQGDPLHAEAPAELLYVPGRHAKHAEAPVVLKYDPAGHGAQTDDEWAPVELV